MAAAWLSVWVAVSPEPSPSGSPHRRTVTVDLSGVDPVVFARIGLADIYKSLLVRITQGEFAAVDSTAEADIELTYQTPQEGAVTITTETGSQVETSRVELGSRSTQDLQLAILNQSMVLLRRARDRLPPPTEPSHGHLQKELNLATAWLWGPGDSGPLVRVGGRVGPERGFGLGAHLWLHLPIGVDDRLRIVEAVGAIAGMYRGRLGTTQATWQATLGLGGLVHSYGFHDEATGAEDSGLSGDLVAITSLALTLTLTRAWHLSFEAGALGSWVEWHHRSQGRSLWHSTHIRGYAGVTVDYTAP